MRGGGDISAVIINHIPISYMLGGKTMNRYRMSILTLITISLLSVAEAEYIVDIMFPRARIDLSLNINAAGHAKKDYDAFIMYPSSFEMDDVPRPSEWVRRGIGTFAEITITNVGDDQFLATFFLEDAEMGEWTPSSVKKLPVRLPSFRSLNMSTTNLSMLLGKWISLGDACVDGVAVEGFQIRVRESVAPMKGAVP